MKLCILKTFFNPSSILRARLGSRTELLLLKKWWFSIVSIQAQNLLTFFTSLPVQKRFISSTRQALEFPCSHLICHLHTKNSHLQKRSLNQCFGVFLWGAQTKETSAYICKAICYIRLEANMLHLEIPLPGNIWGAAGRKLSVDKQALCNQEVGKPCCGTAA